MFHAATWVLKTWKYMKVNQDQSGWWYDLARIIGIIDHKRSTIMAQEHCWFQPIPGMAGLPTALSFSSRLRRSSAKHLVKLGMACCWAYTYDIIIMAMTGRHWWLMITDGYKHPENIQEWTSLNEPYTWALIEINIAKMVWFGYAFVISSILGLWTL